MRRNSVEGYNIHDKNGRVLYDGDYVEMCWGGRDGKLIYRTHRLRISKSGKLKLHDCENIVIPRGLVKLDVPEHRLGTDYHK